MSRRERVVVGALAVSFAVAAALIIVLVPSQRETDPVLVIALVLLYAVVSRVEFEVGSGVAVPTQLVLFPLLFLAPLPFVPVLVMVAYFLADAPELVRGRVHSERWLNCFCDSWHTVGPVLVLALLAPGEPSLQHVDVYALALAAQLAIDASGALARERVVHGIPVIQTLRSLVWSYRIDAALTPAGIVIGLAAAKNPLALLAVPPLVWMLANFSKERQERYAAALELAQAYQGTVLLLSDVVESDDSYTGNHCRSVVEMVSMVAEEMGVKPDERQELEFAALLHDIGKIATPKEVLNKPAALTPEEFEIMKKHTVEGQLMLDRVGGVLARVGQTVRSSHERWDGAGYPDGLAAEEIPLGSRIVFCCDAYSAMTTNRPYRSAMSQETAIAELRGNAGTQFDPQVVEALLRVLATTVPDPGREIDQFAPRVFGTIPMASRLEAAS